MKEKFANFLSYVVFFGFVIGVSLVGFYVWKHRPIKTTVTEKAEPGSPDELQPDVVTEVVISPGQTPSSVLNPLMAKSLPKLWAPLDENPIELNAGFALLEEAVAREKGRPGNLQPAWLVTGQLCAQIRSVVAERNAAAAALFAEPAAVIQKTSVTPRSKAEEKELAAKREFFKGSAQARWTSGVPAHKKKIEAVYRQLLAAEAQASL